MAKEDKEISNYVEEIVGNIMTEMDAERKESIGKYLKRKRLSILNLNKERNEYIKRNGEMIKNGYIKEIFRCAEGKEKFLV